jgi:6-pyruvoyltetrahydropterin/6-carboxytetrahydropterin synthase
MITATRRLQFAAGHRVVGHEGKCAAPHGHNYVVFLEAHATKGLDPIGRVIDFGVLKERVGTWIDNCWDHGFIFKTTDRDMSKFLMSRKKWKWYSLRANPTAENMADFLLRYVCPSVLKDTGVTVGKVTLWETENCFAEAKL